MRPVLAGGPIAEGGSRRIGGRETALWTIGALSLFFVWGLFVHQRLLNDGYQYLSVAENLAAGRGIATSLVHFDVERAHGTLPAPLTTFAPGFPIAVVAFCKAGMTPETAALAISTLALALTMGLLASACNALALDPLVSRAVMLLFALNAYTLSYAGTIASEALFTLLLTTAVTSMLLAEQAEDRPMVLLFSAVAGVAIGLSYCVRYAGLLAIAGLGTALGVLLLARRTRRALEILVLTLAPAGVLVAAGFARNVRLTGRWQGGNTKVVHHSQITMLENTAIAFWKLLLGDGTSLAARACQGLFLLTLGIALVRWRRWPRGPGAPRAFIVAAVAGLYSAFMFLVGSRSVISYGARMFLPVLPLFLLLLGAVVAPVTGARWARGTALVGCVAYALCALLNAPPTRSGHLELASRLARPMSDGRPMRAWIDAHIGMQEPLLAADGQATGHLLRRPVVSLVGNEYSDEVWSEAEIERTMERFGLRYLILYAPATGVETESPFLSALSEGRPGRYLRLAARNDASLVFEHGSTRQ
jgi:hypothetical protein